MVVRLEDPCHGHLAIFHAATAHLSASPDVVWGPSSISVPDTSILNGPADVWLHLPSVPISSFKSWCTRLQLPFLGARASRLGFRAPHFSRYRYVDSDSDDDSAPSHPPPRPDDRSRPPPSSRRRHLRPPVDTQDKPSAPMSSSTSIPPSMEASRQTPRPRMSTRVIDDLDTDPDPDGEATEDMPEQSDFTKLDDAMSPADPWAGDAHLARDTDLPKLHRFRDTLFAAEADGSDGHAADIDMADATPGRRMSLEELAEHEFFQPTVDDAREPPPPAEMLVAHEAADFIGEDGLPARPPPPDPVLSFAAPAFPILSDSIAKEKQHVFTDHGLLLGRSTRTSFSFAGVHASSFYSTNHGFTVELNEPRAGGIPTQGLVAGLTVHSAMWFQHRDDGLDDGERVRIPTLTVAFRDGKFADGTLRHIINDLRIAQESGDKNAAHASIIFGLLLALYQTENEEETTSGDDSLLRRVAAWGTKASEGHFDDLLPDTAPQLRYAVEQLALGDVAYAVDLAIELGYPRLAMLMARALETEKDSLRQDAIAQLAAYGLRLEQQPEGSQDLDDPSLTGWDRILTFCEDNSNVSIDERMILLILAGQVAPVARFLDFSWYRLFTMELLYGAGSDDMPHADRISAAVRAIGDANIGTKAPHSRTEDEDVAYHILRLYADNTSKYPLTKGIYSNSGFGSEHRPLDSRFSWLLHEVMSALIPEASPKEARLKLADALSLQLRSAGMRLWAFYVLCGSSAPASVLRSTLIRDWPEMQEEAVELDSSFSLALTNSANCTDGDVDMEPGAEANQAPSETGAGVVVDAKTFLQEILQVPHAWLCEAMAVAARVAGDTMRECEFLVDSSEDELAAIAHTALTETIIPRAMAARDATRLRRITELLTRLDSREQQVPDWSHRGGFVLAYLRQVWRDAGRLARPANIDRRQFGEELHELAATCVTAWGRCRSATQRAAMRAMADGIVTAQRALLLGVVENELFNDLFSDMSADLELLPCSRGVKLRISGEYRVGLAHGWRAADRLAAALPAYEKAVARGQDGANGMAH